MLHQYWLNLHFKKLFLTLSLILLNQGEAYSQGPIQTLQNLISLGLSDYHASLSQVSLLNQEDLNNFEKLEDVKLSSSFLVNLIIRNQPYLLALIRRDTCAIAPMLEHQILDGPEGEITRVLVDVKKSNEADYFSVFIPATKFIDWMYKNKCPNYRKLSPSFRLENMAQTAPDLFIKIPEKREDCLAKSEEIILSEKFPYICSIIERIKKIEPWQNALLHTQNSEQKSLLESKILSAQGHQKYFNTFQTNFYKNICQHFDDPKRFCSEYLATGIWSKILNGEKPISMLTLRCEATEKEKQKLEKCAAKFEANNELCHYWQSTSLPSLLPKPSCRELDLALNIGHLNYNYPNCPAMISQTVISTFHELNKHKNPYSTQLDPSICASEPIHDFLALAQNADNNLVWDLSYCYHDPVLQIERCHPTILGSHPTSPFDEGEIFKKALGRFTSIGPSEKCLILSQAEYNPQRLEHSMGCFLLYDPSNCNSLYCPKKAIYKNKEVKNITLRGDSFIEMIHSDSKRMPYTLSKLIEQELKYKIKPLQNLTEINNFFQEHTLGLVLGFGCLEDIFPWKFARTQLGQCRPSSLLIDGVQNQDGKAKMVVRTGLDDVQSPRLIPWNYIYQSVINYQELQNKKNWGLYGLF